MPNSKGRQSKRKDQRKSILFEINRCSDSIVRRDLSIIEIDELFVNISNNQISKFGLEKLSKLQLDIIKENACLPNISLETADASPRTLLEYAIELGRDAIICQLFKAGADIFFRSCLCSSCAHLLAWRGSPMSRKVLARLKLRYYQNIVWILRVARSITSSCSDQICNVPTCEQSSSSSRCTGSRCLLVFPQCSHHVCEVCFWTSVTRLDPIDDLCCGVCARPIQDYPLSIQLSNSRRKFSPQCLITDSVVEVTNVCTKERSKDLWSQLPEQRCVADDEGERQSDQGKGQKPSFIAMSLNQLTSVFIGECQANRNLALQTAVNEGNLRRVRAIVTAGVDIDCRNEYGQTPLFLACWYNCVSALHYLIEIGADPHITDNAGVMPSHLCQMLARNEIIQYLPPPVADSWSLYRPPQESEMPSGSVRILIDPHEAHPGAGSFIADGFLSDNFLAALRNLHQMLPEAIPTKLSCSRRSYYCDATRWVRRELGCALRSIARLIIGSSIGQSVEHSVVSEALPHMRFLEYRFVGGSLAPHIDLTRQLDQRVAMTPYEVEVEVENSLRRMCISTDGVTVEKEGEKDEDENENENEVRRDLTIDSTSRTSTHTFILYLTDCESGGETRLLRKVPGRNFKLTEQENTLAAVQPRAGRLLVFPHSCPHSGAEVTCVPKLLLRGEMI